MIIIIDGNQLACRCYAAMTSSHNREKRSLTTSKGKRTETIYSVLVSVRKIIRERGKKNTILFTWDGGNDKRKAIFPAYKAGRKRFEDAFYEQLNNIREILAWHGIKQYHYAGVEADDLIGTLAFKSRKKGKKVLIISADHDFEQLVSRHVNVLHPLANNLIKDVQYVIDKHGVTPEKLPEAMALSGDDSDNIPGIEGVAEKTAGKLISANGSLENILNFPDDLKFFNKKGEIVKASNVLKQKIKTNIENIKIAYQLVRISTDLDVEPDFSEQETNFEAIKNKFEELEFEQFLNEFDLWETTFKCR